MKRRMDNSRYTGRRYLVKHPEDPKTALGNWSAAILHHILPGESLAELHGTMVCSGGYRAAYYTFTRTCELTSEAIPYLQVLSDSEQTTTENRSVPCHPLSLTMSRQ